MNRDHSVVGPTTGGVRNDIVAYIDSLPDTMEQKRALMQDAAAIQAAVSVDTTNQQAVLAVGLALMRASHCMFNQYDLSAATRKSDDIEGFTVNTPARFDAYERFNTAMSGRTLRSVMSASDCVQ